MEAQTVTGKSIWDDVATLPVISTAGKKQRAEAWLRNLLQEPRFADDVRRLAAEAGIRPATLRRAKQAVGAVSLKSGGYFGGDDVRWHWCLPEDA